MSTARQPAAGPAPFPAGFLEEVDRRVGPRGWTTDRERIAPHVVETWGTGRGRSPLLLRPADVQEVAALLALCHAAGVRVVPQGGNTGLVGGGVPDDSGGMAVLSLGRLNRIRGVDPLNDTITVEAGCVLQTVRDAAAGVNRLFPLALGAQGSAQIGGNLSSNAGGIEVLRHGMARALVLGLEVVLADGQIWDGLRALRKDNTGYDLKQLFIGAEGTLGVITAAVLRLVPRPRERQTAWLGVASPEAAVALLALFRERLGETVGAFELMAGPAVELVLRYLPGARRPLPEPAPWYVLAEVAWSFEEGLAARLEQALEEAMQQGLVQGGAIAASEAQRKAIWALRENPTDAMAHEGVVLRHDVAVPVSQVAALIARGAQQFGRAIPGVRIMPFGHLGDGNIHYNLLQPEQMAAEAFIARKMEVQRRVFDLVTALGGTISAEHGIGRLKRAELAARKSPLELALMRRIKEALDPKGMLNPGAIL
ncbi:MAG TPA: FAD-binding oxidoreductase [Geminicoccaceae bacterium]|nr:FAD-binding oxidoreductase [Geminicoccaceae bacterium]